MTRETKIGLLVGLAFIIVTAILLSDHIRSTNEPPQAALSSITASVRNAVNAPGAGNPPIVLVPPQDAPLPQSVPTHEELSPPVNPVIPSPAGSQSPAAAPSFASNVSSNPAISPAPSINSAPADDHGADGPGLGSNEALREAARRGGEGLVTIDPNGNEQPLTSGSERAATASNASLRPYKAQSGDTLSRLAGRFLGANTKANRQAIVDANPSLAKDVNRIVVGQTYMIPIRTIAMTTPAALAPAAPAEPQTPVHPTIDNPTALASPVVPSDSKPKFGGAQYSYTVQEGDSLWAIANDQLGDPAEIDAIKELNRAVLKGKTHDVVTPGMKLRLPAKPVADAN